MRSLIAPVELASGKGKREVGVFPPLSKVECHEAASGGGEVGWGRDGVRWDGVGTGWGGMGWGGDGMRWDEMGWGGA